MFYGSTGGSDIEKQYEAAGQGIYSDSTRDMMSFLWGEMAANNALERQMQFYNSIQSPEAQMRQIKAAGLSPSIFFAKGIGGGAGTSGVAGTARPSANTDAAKLNGIFSAVGQAAQLGTQIAATKAEIQKTKAETREIEERTELTQSQKTAVDLNNTLNSNNLYANIQQAYALAAKYSQEYQTEYWETRNEQQNFEFNKEIFNDKVQIVKNEVELGVKNILLAESNINLNEKKVEDIASQIATRTEQIAQGWIDMQIKGKSQQATEQYMSDQIKQMIKELDFQKEKHVDDFITNIISGSINALGTSLLGPIGSSAAKGILKLFTK